jgi:hypothetical protein
MYWYCHSVKDEGSHHEVVTLTRTSNLYIKLYKHLCQSVVHIREV